MQKINDFPDYPVLIQGASGTGKEVIARYIHYQGEYNDKPFIAVNCSAINFELFESELFGYEKGAFTGALNTGQDGYIKSASGGTLFLDEVSEIPLKSQSKLLRMLQEREYYAVGGRSIKKVNCRIIFASNKNLENMVHKKRFRKDLFYRVNICPIHIPPLKNRPNDIALLLFYFINELNKKLKKSIIAIEAGFIKKALDYQWPGNIRELKNTITNLLMFSDYKVLTKELFDFPINKKQKSDKTLPMDNFELPDEPFDLNEYMNKIIITACQKFDGNKTKAARYLNLSRYQILRKIKKDEK